MQNSYGLSFFLLCYYPLTVLQENECKYLNKQQGTFQVPFKSTGLSGVKLKFFLNGKLIQQANADNWKRPHWCALT